MRGLFRAYDINNERYICEIINESVRFFISSINEVYIEFKIDSYSKKYMVWIRFIPRNIAVYIYCYHKEYLERYLKITIEILRIITLIKLVNNVRWLITLVRS